MNETNMIKDVYDKLGTLNSLANGPNTPPKNKRLAKFKIILLKILAELTRLVAVLALIFGALNFYVAKNYKAMPEYEKAVWAFQNRIETYDVPNEFRQYLETGETIETVEMIDITFLMSGADEYPNYSPGIIVWVKIKTNLETVFGALGYTITFNEVSQRYVITLEDSDIFDINNY